MICKWSSHSSEREGKNEREDALLKPRYIGRDWGQNIAESVRAYARTFAPHAPSHKHTVQGQGKVDIGTWCEGATLE